MRVVFLIALLPTAAISTVVVDYARTARDRAFLTQQIRALPDGRRNDPNSPCGAVALSVAARLLGSRVSLNDAVAAVGADPLGRTSMKELVDATHEIGLAAQGLTLSAGVLRRVRSPVILYVHGSHFLVGMARRDGRIVLIDPPGRPRLVELSSLDALWSGNCILVEKNAAMLRHSLEQMGL